MTRLCLALLLLPFAPLSAQVSLSPAGDGHTVVPVTVNGSGPFPFVLDSGADSTVVYQWFADQQHLPAGKPEMLDGQTGSAQVATYRLVSVTLDAHSLHGITADSLPNRHDAGKQAGVIGNDLMDTAIVVFDFPCNRVHLLPSSTNLRSLVGGRPSFHTGLVKVGTQLTFPVSLNGVDGWAVLDTGSRDTRINTKFATAAHIDTSAPGFHFGTTIYGATSQAMSSRVGPLGTLAFGGVSVPNVTGRVMDLAAFQTFGLAEGPAMILGADVMGSFKVVYDHHGRRVWFLPSSCKR